MKNNQITFVLVGVFFICAALTFWYGQSYNVAFNRAQDTEGKLNRMRFTQLVADHLLSDALEYSKKDSAIQPLLQIATNAAVTPATKSPVK